MESRLIFRKLNEYLKIVQQNYAIENIFGIFVTEIYENEIKTEAIVIPTFEDVCTSVSTIHTSLAEGHIIIYDVREVYEATKIGHPEVVNLLHTEYKIINPIYEHIFQKIVVSNKDKIHAGIASGEPANELRIAIMKVCRHCWSENSNVMRFIKQISDAEKLALNGIIKIIGDEGVLSQAKAASAIGVSRLTMSNLIMKMKFCEVAEVEYLGNKGTYIKFIDDTLLNINGQPIKI